MTNTKLDNITVVIRSIGEDTEALCKQIVCDQVFEENVITINEKPFWKAVQRTFELGLERAKPWTLAIDADVLISPNAVQRAMSAADAIGPNLYIYQGYVHDFIFGSPREGGPHLYRTEWLQDALDVLTNNEKSLRPESDTYKVLAAQKGLLKYVDNQIFGIHDFGQSLPDLYRKAYIHSIKHGSAKWNRNFIEYWLKNLDKQEFRVLFKGWVDGKLSKGKIPKSPEEFRAQYDHSFKDELSTLGQTGLVTYDDYRSTLKSLSESRPVLDKRILPAKKKNPWERLLIQIRKLLLLVGRAFNKLANQLDIGPE